MRLVFDLDNTLYCFGKTGIADAMHKNIVDYMVTNLNMKHDDARAMSTDYYLKYGLTIAGLIQFHGVDPVHYCNYVHQIEAEKRLPPDPAVTALMQQLVAEGHDIWVLTNANHDHAERLLTILGCLECFRSPKTNKLKVIDCFAQWEYSKPEVLNKPSRSAYEHCLEVFRDAEQDGTAEPNPSGTIVLVDDSLKNLEEPVKMGWKTVWVQHDIPHPPEEQVLHHHTIREIYEFHRVLDELKEEEKVNQSNSH